MKLNTGSWTVHVVEDRDGHLTITASHDMDESAIVEVEQDLADSESEFAVRLTTEKIEADYQKTI